MKENKETAPLNPIVILAYKFNHKLRESEEINLKRRGRQEDSHKKMERQRNNSQMEGKEESSERMLNKIQTSQLSDIEFKTIVIMKRHELIENYQKR